MEIGICVPLWISLPFLESFAPQWISFARERGGHPTSFWSACFWRRPCIAKICDNHDGVTLVFPGCDIVLIDCHLRSLKRLFTYPQRRQAWDGPKEFADDCNLSCIIRPEHKKKRQCSTTDNKVNDHQSRVVPAQVLFLSQKQS